MTRTFITIIVLCFVTMLFIPEAAGSLTAAEEPNLQTPPVVEAEKEVTQKTSSYGFKGSSTQAVALKQELRTIALSKGLSEDKILQIEGIIGGDGVNAICPNGESGWNPQAVGDSGRSYGLVQIHLPAHPHITKEQALDPTFALNFIVDEFLQGNEWKWTCYKAIYN